MTIVGHECHAVVLISKIALTLHLNDYHLSRTTASDDYTYMYVRMMSCGMFVPALHCRLILNFPEAVAMLRENGVEMGDFDDLR